MGIANIEAPAQPATLGEECAWLSDLIKNLVGALITTVDSQGVMHTRQLPNTNSHFQGDLWFLSAFGTPLVDEVRAHPDVLVTYADRRARRFVVLNGVARVQRDEARARALWHPTLASWIPAGPGDPALALIQVRVESVDLWE